MYFLARTIVFLSVTLGGSFAFLALTMPGNSAPLSCALDVVDCVTEWPVTSLIEMSRTYF